MSPSLLRVSDSSWLVATASLSSSKSMKERASGSEEAYRLDMTSQRWSKAALYPVISRRAMHSILRMA